MPDPTSDSPPSDYHIEQVFRHVRVGRTVISAFFRAGVTFGRAVRWLERGRNHQCPACVKLVKAIRQAGRDHDDEHLKKITVRPEE